MNQYSSPARLTTEHELEHFSSSSESLNVWLRKYAFMNQQAGMTVTYVSTLNSSSCHVVGYHALAAGSVNRELTPGRLQKGIENHPVLVIILARLAVDAAHVGRGLGRALFNDALQRVAVAADRVGVRALLVHAKDERTRAFYLQCAEFESSPMDPLQLFLSMKDIRTAGAIST